MTRTLYSERLLKTEAVGVWTSRTVPQGKRWVVRTVLCSGDLANLCSFQVAIDTTLVFTVRVPASEGSRATDMRLVLYEGEALKAFQTHPSSTITVSGYEFDDPSASQARIEANRPATPPDPWAVPPPAAGGLPA